MGTDNKKLVPMGQDGVDPRPMLAEAIASTLVLAALNKIEPFGPFVPQYGELSEAIAQASNEDPLFPEDEHGCRKTAAILIAVAWYESRFQPNAVGNQGKSFGLYQIRPVEGVPSNAVTNPRSASFVVIDQIRTSFEACKNQPYGERLLCYVSSNGPASTKQEAVKKSYDRLLMAMRIWPMLIPPPVALLQAR